MLGSAFKPSGNSAGGDGVAGCGANSKGDGEDADGVVNAMNDMGYFARWGEGAPQPRGEHAGVHMGTRRVQGGEHAGVHMGTQRVQGGTHS
eukprot:6012377-Prymnesium_polylepis.2